MMTHKRKIRWLRGITAAFSVICACTLFGTKVHADYSVTIPTKVMADSTTQSKEHLAGAAYEVSVGPGESGKGINADQRVTLAAVTGQNGKMYVQKTNGKTTKTYDGNNGTKEYSLSLSVTQGKKDFWTSSDVANKVSRSDSYEIKNPDNKTLVAGEYNGNIQYTAAATYDANYQYTAWFDANGGTYTDKKYTSENKPSIKSKKEEPFGNKLPDGKSIVTRPGYTFAGWYKDDGTQITKDTKMPANVNGTTYYAHWTLNAYTIHYDMNDSTDTHKGYFPEDISVKESYTVEDKPFTLPVVQRAGYGFLGWVQTDKDGKTPDKITPNANLTVQPGVSEDIGDLYYKAVWTTDMIAVHCEDWVADWNGEPYSRFNTLTATRNISPGATVNSEALFGTRSYGEYSSHATIFHEAEGDTLEKRQAKQEETQSTITVTADNHTVRRMFYIKGIWTIGEFRTYDEWAGLPVTFDATFQAVNRQGQVLFTKDFTNMSALGFITAQQIRQTLGFSIDQGVPAGCSFEHNNVTNLKSSTPGYTYSNRGSSPIYYVFKSDDWQTKPYWVAACWQIRKWNQSEFTTSTVVGDADSSWLQDCRFEFPDGSQEPVEMQKTQSGICRLSAYVSPNTKVRLDATLQPGYTGNIADNYLERPVPASGNSNNGTVTVTSACEIWSQIYQNAYGVAFNANGGSGNMANFCIDNTKPAGDNARKLPANKYTKLNMNFRGWATSQERADQGIIDYTDGAMMPVIDSSPSSIGKLQTFNICQTTTLYAVWGK